MAKEKRAADDLDAELAALEAELAALEGGKKGKKSAKADAPAADAPSKKPKLGLKLGKKKDEPAPAAPPAAEPAPEPARAPAPAPALAPAPPHIPVTDGSRWRQEGHAWIRTVDSVKPVVRRILDEEGRVVREEPATLGDLDNVTGVKAEKGLGRLFRRGSS